MILIKLFSSIDDQSIIKNIDFNITGTGDANMILKLEKSIALYIKKGGYAKYHGYVDSNILNKLYSNANILLALQKPDGKFSKYCFPSKVFEFYRYNKPIITTNISDLDDTSFFNLNFIDYDIDSLSNTINDIMLNFQDFKKLNENNSELIGKLYSTEKNQQKMNRFLKKMANE